MFTLCPFALVFGIPCPGCGMGRSVLHALAGDFALSFALHPMGPLVVVTAGAFVSLWASAGVSSRSRRWLAMTQKLKFVSKLWTCVLSLTIAVWVARFFGALGGPAVIHSPWPTLLGYLS